MAAKSLLTATVYLRNLGLYCDLNKTDPKSILKVARTKAFRMTLLGGWSKKARQAPT